MTAIPRPEQSLIVAPADRGSGRYAHDFDVEQVCLQGVGWLWLDEVAQLTLGSGESGPLRRCCNASKGEKTSDGNCREGKLRAARWFFDVELPSANQALTFVASTSGVASSMPDGAF